MAFKKKTWVDRISEYPTRRRLKKTDGSTEIVTVTREEGTISKEGDAFSSANMNDLEKRISDEFDNVNNSLSDLNRKVLVGSSYASSTSYATVGGVNAKVAEYKMLYLQATINTNFFSIYVPVDALASGFNPTFRTGAENSNVQFTYVYGVNGGQIQLNEFTVDGVEYNTHTNANLVIYAMN